jgi:hypothetical protein
MEDFEGGERRRRGEGEDERIWQGFSRRVAAAVGLGLLGVAALTLVEGVGARNGGSVSLAASDLGSNGENRNVRESAAMKAFDVVKKDMDKLQADLDRVRVCLVPCAALRVLSSPAGAAGAAAACAVRIRWEPWTLEQIAYFLTACVRKLASPLRSCAMVKEPPLCPARASRGVR